MGIGSMSRSVRAHVCVCVRVRTCAPPCLCIYILWKTARITFQEIPSHVAWDKEGQG